MIITKYKLFEAGSKPTPGTSLSTLLYAKQQRFLARYGDDIGKFKIVDDEFNVSGPVNLSRKNLSEIPIKFGSVNGSFDCSRNNLKSFEFLPDFCPNYYIYDNPGYEGTLKEIHTKLQKVDDYQNLWIRFIKECLDFHVWSDGQTNEYAMREVFLNIKNGYYFEDRNFIKVSSILTLDDKEILDDYFKLKDKNWLNDLITKVLDELKVAEGIARISLFHLLFNISKSEESEEVKRILIDDYDLEDFYNKFDELSKIKYRKTEFQHVDSLKKINNELEIVSKKLMRSEDEIQRDQEQDLFVFIASDKFEKNKSGSYDKKLDIENLCKINIYDVSDLQSINMMKIRSRAQNSQLYKIWLPKETFDVDKDNYYPDDIPKYILELIDKYKEVL